VALGGWEDDCGRGGGVHAHDILAGFSGEVGKSRPPASLGEEAVWAGVPPFKAAIPAFPVRSSRIQPNGRKRRSCSPVRL